MHESKWTPAEKRIARWAYEQALERRFECLINETKRRASLISEPKDLWDLERWLTDERKEIDHIFDYRYSALPRVFAILIGKELLSASDLDGLEPDKITQILQAIEGLNG